MKTEEIENLIEQGHCEFVVLFKDESRDWIDPVVSVQETYNQIIVNNGFYDYSFDKGVIARWTVRPYTVFTTYDPF